MPNEKLPNAARASISADKLVYLLSPRPHSDKSGFFRRFGFTLYEPDILAAALLQHGQTQPVVEIRTTPYGLVYETLGPLTSPDGRNPFVLVAWELLTGASLPRLVTAVPAKVGKR